MRVGESGCLAIEGRLLLSVSGVVYKCSELKKEEERIFVYSNYKQVCLRVVI